MYNELISALRTCVDMTKLCSDCQYYSRCMANTSGKHPVMVDAVDAIEELSKRVEVVRCRDCIFGNTPCAMSRYPDYFCADGKRKNGGQDDT